MKRSGRDSNLRPLGCKSDALTTTPRHAIIGLDYCSIGVCTLCVLCCQVMFLYELYNLSRDSRPFIQLFSIVFF